jgi:hydrogenase maturation protease
MTILILGIGQSLRSDDSAGLAAVTAWQEAYPRSARHPSVRVELAEMTGLSLLDDLLGAEAAILVDAVRSGRKPGSILLLEEADLAAFEAGSGSAHGLGVAETLALGRWLYPEDMPEKVVIIGIEAGEIGMGEKLSPAVLRSMPKVAKTIEEQLIRLRNREIRE